jgi:hypothetical protein
VYVTHASGTIDRFADGRIAELLKLPANQVPTGPAGLAVGSDSLFVGDPHRGRILQLGRRGEYRRSLQADDDSQLRNMRDLALSDDGKLLYVLSGSTILCFAIPMMP